jgi:hypothetical protein
MAFAQDKPEKLAVYVSGASDAGVNKSLSGKLLLAMTQGGRYAEIGDPGAFQDELARGKGDMAQIFVSAKLHGADHVCVVNIAEAFGAYSITARLIRVADLQALKTGSADRSLKSLDDLTAVSSELARQLLPPGSQATLPPPTTTAVASAAIPAAAQKQCAKTYNINELLFNIKDGFPNQLKDCSSKLAKDMLTPASLGGKKLEPKSFMKQCPLDGIKKNLEGFPDSDKIIGSVDNFVQGLLASTFAGGALDPKKLVSAVGSMNIEGLLGDVKKIAVGNSCIVEEPYEPSTSEAVKNSNPEVEDKNYGIRIGIIMTMFLAISAVVIATN